MCARWRHAFFTCYLSLYIEWHVASSWLKWMLYRERCVWRYQPNQWGKKHWKNCVGKHRHRCEGVQKSVICWEIVQENCLLILHRRCLVRNRLWEIRIQYVYDLLNYILQNGDLHLFSKAKSFCKIESCMVPTGGFRGTQNALQRKVCLALSTKSVR